MKLREIIKVLEQAAPRQLQDDYDNSGLQLGFPEDEISKVLVCLDVTEEIVEEAAAGGCNLIVSHHPLIFHALKQISDTTYQQRCVSKALKAGIAIYSAHTSLDNAQGGVNYKIAELIGAEELEWLSAKEGCNAGSGVVGVLKEEMQDADFLDMLKERFGVECLRHSEPDGRMIRKVAICGGSGAFLMRDAIAKGADCFVCGEFHYHDYFENKGMILAELGHYQSEQFTCELLRDIVAGVCPEIVCEITGINTNPIRYR